MISENSKLIAKYLGWVYIPFNDLQGLKKAGWYKVEPKKSDIQDAKVTTKTYVNGGETIKEETLKVDLNFFRYNVKNGWILNGDNYYQYICRHHSDLRFYNSMDALIPVIESIEDHTGVHFDLIFGGCFALNKFDEGFNIKSFEENLSWTQNTFNVVVEVIKYINNATTVKIKKK